MSRNDPSPLASVRAPGLTGRVRVPGDKSISHRALIFGALATGRTTIEGLLEGDDVLNTARAVSALGTVATKHGQVWQVLGRGTGGLHAPCEALDFGNSGTGARLMLGVVAGHDMVVQFTGDASLSKRPMKRVLGPLQTMGLSVIEGRDDRLPLTVRGTTRLIPIDYELPVPSAQVKSAVLLAGLHARGETTVIEAEPTRDHTERMLRYFGADVAVARMDGRTRVTVKGQPELVGRSVVVPGDPSSAAFIVAGAVIVPGSDVLIENVLVNETRVGFYDTLTEMGAEIAFENEREEGGERIADIRARSSRLRGVNVPASRAPSMIDEYPVLAAVAAFADGETCMHGLHELTVKESDRLAATAAGLAEVGVRCGVAGESLTVQGAQRVRGGGLVKTHLDHRIAMAFLTLGLATDRPVAVDDASMIATSFPQFRSIVECLGGEFTDVGGHDA